MQVLNLPLTKQSRLLLNHLLLKYFNFITNCLNNSKHGILDAKSGRRLPFDFLFEREFETHIFLTKKLMWQKSLTLSLRFVNLCNQLRYV